MELGLIGVKFSGKSTLFELLTGNHFEILRSGLAESRRGRVVVPDPRVDTLSEIFKPKKTTHATFNCIDIMGIPSGNRHDTSSKYLEAVRQVDGLVAVIRGFEGYGDDGKAVTINPPGEIRHLEEEIQFADLMVAESRLEKVEHLKQRGAPQYDKHEHDILIRCKEALDGGKPIREISFTEEEEKRIRGFQFLSAKPFLAVLNCSETRYQERDVYIRQVKETFPDMAVTAVSALSEKEIQELEEEDRALFMEELGIDEPAIHHVIRASYEGLGLLSFFTVGEDEVRAWTLRQGLTAPAAAGVIHSDLEKGFIRAEVISYDVFMETQSMTKAKANGQVRLEGKDYVVQDGDILNIRFNV
jgi:GTP-binding protein YchF